ncbi:helix-turn-helix domain-containing protein [Mesorhizobium sp. M0768]|uniref:helix-turn-helix domain-containing protein n=1 Tax=Mesorhizobium sp. M0768 TaxID=2956996 RepID=UPI003337A566
MRYYRRVRLEWAKRLIEQTNMPFLEIAVACGFISSSHFSKSFRSFRQGPERLSCLKSGRSSRVYLAASPRVVVDDR